MHPAIGGLKGPQSDVAAFKQTQRAIALVVKIAAVRRFVRLGMSLQLHCRRRLCWLRSNTVQLQRLARHHAGHRRRNERSEHNAYRRPAS